MTDGMIFVVFGKVGTRGCLKIYSCHGYTADWIFSQSGVVKYGHLW